MAKELAEGVLDALPARRPGRPVNEEMRGLAVAAVLREGMSMAAAAKRFGLSPSTVHRLVTLFREHGHVRAKKQGGSRPQIDRERARILRLLEAQPELTVRGLRAALAAEGVAFQTSTVQSFLKRNGLERKRRLAARRRERRRGRK